MLKTLLSLRLRSMLSVLNGSQRTKKKQSRFGLAAFTLLMLVSFSSLGFLFWHIFDMLSEPFASFGLGELYFALLALLSFALMFIGSIFTAKSQLFEARDNELLLSLPIRPLDILLSRLFVLWLVAFLLALPVGIPALLVWKRPIGPAGWLSALLVLAVLLPGLCLALSAFVGWIVHRIAARFGHKSSVTVFLWLLFLGGYMWLSFHWHSALESLAADPARLAGSMSMLKLPLWAGRAISDGDLAALGMLALVVLPLCALVCLLLAATFVRTATDRRGSARKRYVEREAPAHSLRTALLLRELRRLWGTPSYLFNSGIGAVMALLGAAVLLVKAGDLNVLLSAAGVEELRQMLQMIAIPALCLLASMIYFTAPSISLESKTLWLAKSLPVDTKELLRAKLRMHILLSVPPVLLLAGACAAVLQTRGLRIALTLLLPTLYCVLIGLVGLEANLRFPNFDWINETQAVKTGVSVLLTMFIGVTAAALPVLLYVVTRRLVSLELFGSGTAAVLALVCLLLYRHLMSRGGARFDRL